MLKLAKDKQLNRLIALQSRADHVAGISTKPGVLRTRFFYWKSIWLRSKILYLTLRCIAIYFCVLRFIKGEKVVTMMSISHVTFYFDIDFYFYFCRLKELLTSYFFLFDNNANITMFLSLYIIVSCIKISCYFFIDYKKNVCVNRLLAAEIIS